MMSISTLKMLDKLKALALFLWLGAPTALMFTWAFDEFFQFQNALTAAMCVFAAVIPAWYVSRAYLDLRSKADIGIGWTTIISVASYVVPGFFEKLLETKSIVTPEFISKFQSDSDFRAKHLLDEDKEEDKEGGS